MKKLWVWMFLLNSLLFADLNWAEDYDSALSQAQKEHKKVIVMFTISGCHVCKMMRDDVYSDAEVIAYVEKYFVPVDLNLDFDDKEGYEVFGTPTFYFLDFNAKQIGDVKIGGSNKMGFMRKLREIQASK